MYYSLSSNTVIDPSVGSVLFDVTLEAGDYFLAAEAGVQFGSDGLVYLFISNGDLPLLSTKVLYEDSGNYGSLSTSRFLHLDESTEIKVIASVVGASGDITVLAEDNETHFSVIEATGA